ncbi:hypothetical protein BTJ39_11650 [Izhakiella australiensis]|uniref:diguanylate cyclase n=1 Tax=Izhakiella australiensis TaxID=1926881 RepID=A0A1S8YLF4_9GAMM|nr:diguanylate cyclase [Izhakiella australiensis]OON39687.1 hypothetical protein BTJ39_11650 [Izhakiella australiensis]
MTTDSLLHSQGGRLPWAQALLLGLISFVSTLFCLELIKINGAISPLWFATPLMAVVTFRFPLRQLPLLLPACLIGDLLSNAWVFGAGYLNLKYPAVNLLQALACGALLRLALNHQNPLNSLFSWVKFLLIGVLIIPFAGGLVALLTLHHPQLNNFNFYSTWVVSEVLGMLTLGPVGLLWQRSNVFRQRQAQAIEQSLTLVGSLLLSYIALRFLPWPFTFVIIILFWCAIRLPLLQAFVLFLANIMLMSLMMALNMIDLRNSYPDFSIALLWLPFMLVLIPSHMMLMVMHEAREEKKHIQESETRFRNAMEYSAIGMALVSPEGRFLKVNKSLSQLLGYRENELLQMHFQQITHPDDLSNDIRQIDALLRGAIESYELEKRYFRCDGEVVLVQLTVSLVHDAENLPLYFISQIEDITGLKRTQETNRRLMERITLANKAGGIGVWEWNMKSGVMSWDKRMFEIYGLPADDNATYLTWANSLYEPDRQLAIDAFDIAVRNASPVDIEFRIDTLHGIRYIRAQATVVKDAQGIPERMLGINQDVTRIRLLNEALYQEKERMHITLDAIGEAVISTDEEMRVSFMNPVAERMSGWTQLNAQGQPLSAILRISRDHDDLQMENLLRHNLPPDDDQQDDLILHNDAGEKFAIHYSISPLKTLDGDNIGSVIVIQDVSESREIFKKLSYSASHDMLTRLPNRVNFEHQLNRLLLSAAEQRQQHSLVFIDLDHFKTVNDSAGHAAGDALLRQVAGVMRLQLRATDILARLGGDEFGLLLAGCAPDQALPVVKKIVSEINRFQFIWQQTSYHVGASAGITLISRENCQASDVMVQADQACYQAKHKGRGQVCIFQAGQR